VAPTTTRRVVCVGDSITRGLISVNYVDLLNRRFRGGPWTFINRGVNYHLAFNVLARLDQVIADEPDHVTVLIGTNDANATLSERNLRMMTRTAKLPAAPTPDRFREHLGAIVDRLRHETSATVALLSLPVLGEDLDSVPVRRAGEFSAIIAEVAAERGVAYLPLYERQVEDLRRSGHRPGTAYRDGSRLASTGSMQHIVLRRSLDDIARRRGLRLTTDTVHQNSRGAGMIADLIEGHLTAALTPSSP
jgi:lysophospholipase L1-like esterase